MSGAVLICGGTGFIGRHVVRALQARGASVWVWSRNARRAQARLGSAVHVVATLAAIPPDVPIDGIVNLAGAPVIGPPWTRARRALLIASRVDTTRALLEWCAARRQRPAAMVTASAIGFYGPHGDEWLDESTPPQDAFQSRLCVEREAAANAAEALDIRAANLRIGLVLGRDGGIFQRLAFASGVGMGAVIGNGLQWMSWVHIADMVRVVELALADPKLRGAVNVVAPQPVRQLYFQRALAGALRRPRLVRVPAWLLHAVLGEMAELLTRGQRVAPRALQARGFSFSFPDYESALANLTRARS